MVFDFSFAGLMVSMAVSGIGYVFFRYGRRMGRSIFAVTGLVIMVFPYFVSDTKLVIGITAAVCAVLYFLKARGF